ncbi:uncharacterized protein [Diadema setosum]|uniref:uncharacterized protein n=1 Tax=Diadema setosum TaxID=31175 RepID=UPI003B3B45D2
MATNAASYYDNDGTLSDHKLITMSTLIGNRYPELGQRLGMTLGQLEEIRQSSPGNLQHQVFTMLAMWRDIHRDKATLSVLQDVLKDLGWTSVYTQIRNTHDNFYVVL